MKAEALVKMTRVELETADGLVRGGMDLKRATEAAGLAKTHDAIRPGLQDNVHELATGGRLTNPDGLVTALREVGKGDSGKAVEIGMAADASRAGDTVQLGAVGGIGGDVVNQTRETVTQVKEITSKDPLKVDERLGEAAHQLAGKGQRGRSKPGDTGTEVPPTSKKTPGTPFTRTVEIVVREANPVFHETRPQLGQRIRETLLGSAHATPHGSAGAVDRVIVRNGTEGSPHVFVGPDFKD
jgi:hypothetical protein